MHFSARRRRATVAQPIRPGSVPMRCQGPPSKARYSPLSLKHMRTARRIGLQVLPLERGAGLEQPGLAAAEAKLAQARVYGRRLRMRDEPKTPSPSSVLTQGEWVHMFPEGTRSTDGGRSVGLARRGVGRRYVEAAAQAAARGGTVVSLPLLVPLVHRRACTMIAPRE